MRLQEYMIVYPYYMKAYIQIGRGYCCTPIHVETILNEGM